MLKFYKITIESLEVIKQNGYISITYIYTYMIKLWFYPILIIQKMPWMICFLKLIWFHSIMLIQPEKKKSSHYATSSSYLFFLKARVNVSINIHNDIFTRNSSCNLYFVVCKCNYDTDQLLKNKLVLQIIYIILYKLIIFYKLAIIISL